MLIISAEQTEQGQHLFESQSHREECWMEGYAAVPTELEEAVTGCMGYCDVTIENGVVTAVEPHPERIPVPEPTQTQPTAQDDTDALLVDHEYRLTLLELGLTE